MSKEFLQDTWVTFILVLYVIAGALQSFCEVPKIRKSRIAAFSIVLYQYFMASNYVLIVGNMDV